MLKFLFVVLAAHLVLSAPNHDHEHDPAPVELTTPGCGANEEYKCKSSTCSEGTCDKPQVGPQCTYDCRLGCYCAEGFYRNAEHICVTKEECPEGSLARTYVETPDVHE
ncbi:unnamed protein product [Ixodes hexagonus]